MRPIEALTDFSEVRLPTEENEISRRYLAVIQRWVPVGMRYFNPWPVRPNCGHFFGGVLWYGQDTSMPISALALAASSPEYDAQLAGRSADEVRDVALQGLRYLCFTHDTGPEDCVRPEASWGRPEPAGTKWGERGAGFFREGQCGRSIALMTVTAAMIHGLLGDEEREMLANIAADYMARFEDMPPQSGVYSNTQTEENAWTALGLTACCLLLRNHPKHDVWWEHAKSWMFCVSTKPEDVRGWVPSIEPGKTVAQLARRVITTHPDGTVENHGFVHPSYMAAGLSLGADNLALLGLFQREPPPHIFWRRREIYEILKSWCDAGGAPQAVQSMDWPYLDYFSVCRLHSFANLWFADPDAAMFESAGLEVLERSSKAHGGRLVPEECARLCHGPQDPALMRERLICRVGYIYLSHRLNGVGEAPGDWEDLTRRNAGVRVYPHGGLLTHRHPHGLTSLAWRNRTLVLPCPSQGRRLIGPGRYSVAARVAVEGRAEKTVHVALRVREAPDRVAALLVEDLAEETVRREFFFASLPDGACLTFERLIALQDCRVERVEQGTLTLINDGYFGDHPDLRGRRHVYWQDHDQVVEGYAAESADEDTTLDLGETSWVNLDDCYGVVFRGGGRAVYVNRHHFEVWRAVCDDLVLSLRDEPEEYAAGERIAELAALWLPERTREETAGARLSVLDVGDDVLAVALDGFVCAANFGDAPAEVPVDIGVKAGRELPGSWSVSLVGDSAVTFRPRVGPMEPVILETAG